MFQFLTPDGADFFQNFKMAISGKLLNKKNSKLSRKHCPDLKIAQFGQQLLKLNSAI